MSIDVSRITAEITVSSVTQSATTVSIMGRIDQILIESTVSVIFNIKIVHVNSSQIIWEKKGLNIIANETINDLRPLILPRGKVTITISDPSDTTGVVTVTLIEKDRS